ncbi:MAG: hypothetical protein LBH82_02230 [Bacteroidales bacterium]|jgi:hypothetical protein|nr:hypothetical protein [Bacteroidales bacterium]
MKQLSIKNSTIQFLAFVSERGGENTTIPKMKTVVNRGFCGKVNYRIMKYNE